MTASRISVPGVLGGAALDSKLTGCRIIQLPKVEDLRGNLSFIEQKRHVPFAIRRVYWVYDVPGGGTRDAHAYRTLEEFIIAVSGSFDVAIDDGKERSKVQLNRSYAGLYVPPMVWRGLENFSSNSVALVLASQPFLDEEYLREYDDFTRQVKAK
jgi:glyoxylate utilization-related uncharacterized protein